MKTVRDIMTSELVTLSKLATVAQARELMRQHHIRQIPITSEGGKLEGIVSQRDIHEVSLSRLTDDTDRRRELIEKNITLDEIMTREVETISPASLSSAAAAKLHELRVGALPVVDEGVLVGLISSSDFLSIASQLLSQLEEHQRSV
jgi:CBS domain-containing protein